MQEDRVTDPSGTDVNICEKHSYKRREEELLEVAVKQTEHYSRHNDTDVFTVLYRPVYEHLTEDKLLEYRCAYADYKRS